MLKNMLPGKKVGEFNLDRVNGFSDGVFAIIITIMVLDLKRPAEASFRALFELWPTWLSYIVSYVFLAVVWMNHHYLTCYAAMPTPRMLWANFAHLFSVSWIPFLTAWMAETGLAPVPVVLYAFVFFLVNLTYMILLYETLCSHVEGTPPRRMRRILYYRCIITMAFFLVAMILAFWFPHWGFIIICCCLVLYLRPDAKHLQFLNTYNEH